MHMFFFCRHMTGPTMTHKFIESEGLLLEIGDNRLICFQINNKLYSEQDELPNFLALILPNGFKNLDISKAPNNQLNRQYKRLIKKIIDSEKSDTERVLVNCKYIRDASSVGKHARMQFLF